MVIRDEGTHLSIYDTTVRGLVTVTGCHSLVVAWPEPEIRTRDQDTADPSIDLG